MTRAASAVGRFFADVDSRGLPASTQECVRASDYDAIASSHADLLAALQGVVRVADRNTDEFNAARAAIARATGERK